MYSFLPILTIMMVPFLFLSNPSLIFLWIFLEISSIMFICMAISEEEIKKKECLLMYFLVQSFGSAILLICLFSWSMMQKTMNMENSNNMNLTILFLISLKIAMAPFHFWLIKMSKLISWYMMGTLLTWQKVIPISFMCTFSSNFFISVICIISLLIGVLSQLKLSSLKMLIAFSSISHLGWMIFPIYSHPIMVLNYLMIYSLILLPIMTLLVFSNSLYLFNQMEYKLIAYLSVLIFSLSGIPPLMGFTLKWISLNCMKSSILIMLLFSLMACLSFYIYIRMMYKSMLFNLFNFNKTILPKNMKFIWAMNLFLPMILLLS